MTTGPAALEPVTLPGHGTLRDRVARLAPLCAAMLGFFVVAMDAQIVNVALPHVGATLGGGLAGLQWVVTGYTVAFSSLLLFAGTLSDRVGARRAYGLGMAVFVLASMVCGLAPSVGVLIAARVVQGVGAALVTPTSLALIRETYQDPHQRTRAVALWALGGSTAAAAAPIVGGLLTQVDWRLIFFVNLPVGALALGLLTRVAPSEQRFSPFDVVGQVSALVALVGLTYGVIEGGSRGFGKPAVLIALGLSLLGALSFITAQWRGRHPMMPLDIFGPPVVRAALIAAFITMAAFYGLVFVQSLYFQQERGMSALQTGLLFLPMTGLVALLNPSAAKLANRYGARLPILVGEMIMALGLLALGLAPRDFPVLAVALLMVPVGVGGSLTVPPLTSLLLETVSPERAGLASGVLNTARQLGGSMGVAASGAVIAALAGFMSGLHVSLLALAVLVGTTILVSLALPKREVA